MNDIKTEWMDCGCGTLEHPVSHAQITTRVVELSGFGRIGEWFDYSSEPERNFHLIVNAPKMFDALRRIANGEFAGNVASAEQVTALRDIARAAVADATFKPFQKEKE